MKQRGQAQAQASDVPAGRALAIRVRLVRTVAVGVESPDDGPAEARAAVLVQGATLLRRRGCRQRRPRGGVMANPGVRDKGQTGVLLAEAFGLTSRLGHHGWRDDHSAVSCSIGRDTLRGEVRTEDGDQGAGDVVAESSANCLGAGEWHPVT